MSQTSTIEISLVSNINLPRQEERSHVDPDRILPPSNGTRELSTLRAAVIIATLTGTTILSSFSNGLMTVGLPRIAKDIGLPSNLLLWPASVYP